MIWAAFGWHGATPVAFCTSRMNSTEYIRILEDYLIPTADVLWGDGPDDWIFQQDNASIHKSAETTKWFEEQDIKVPIWPACSPDLNPIENLWSTLSFKVYDEGRRQFNSVQELQTAIEVEWNKLTHKDFKKLIISMLDRVQKVKKAPGKRTGY